MKLLALVKIQLGVKRDQRRFFSTPRHIRKYS